MAIKVDFYKNKIAGNKNLGKVYVRASSNKMMGIDGLARHIAEHGSPFTVDVIQGVLRRVATCVRELALNGTPVKIDDLCIFRSAVTCKPANDVDSFELTKGEGGNIKSVRLQCRATGEAMAKPMTRDAELGYSSLAQRVKTGEIVLSDKKGEYVATDNDGWGDEPVVNP